MHWYSFFFFSYFLIRCSTRSLSVACWALGTWWKCWRRGSPMWRSAASWESTPAMTPTGRWEGLSRCHCAGCVIITSSFLSFFLLLSFKIFGTKSKKIFYTLPGGACILRADRGGPVACCHVQRHPVSTGAVGPGWTRDCHHAKDPGDHFLLPESCLPGQSKQRINNTLIRIKIISVFM